MKSEAGKGDTPRPYSPTKYAVGWDLIFKKKGKSPMKSSNRPKLYAVGSDRNQKSRMK